MPMSVSLITPYGVLTRRDDAEFVLANGAAGDIGILPGHAPLLTALKIGEVRIRSRKGAERFAVGGGFLEATPEKVVITVESAEHADKIDIERAQQAKQRARERLDAKANDTDIVRAEAALARALNRIRLVQRKAK